MAQDEKFLYLTTTGWKTGKIHKIEIWYVEHEGCYYIVAEHREKTHWVQNIRRKPQVEFYITGDEAVRTTARIPDETAEPELVAAIKAKMDAKYNWSNGLITEICMPENH